MSVISKAVHATISKIEAIPYKIPYITPLEFATGIINDVEHVLVRVHTDEGTIGQAEAPSRPYIYGESQASIVSAIRNWIAPSLIGLSCTQTELAYQKTKWIIANNTAKAAVNLAIWDAFGQLTDLPCSRLLGGYQDRLQVSDMVGYGTTAQMTAHVQRMRDQYGINSFKIKTGRDVHSDIAACRAIRQAFPDAYLYLDANHGWTSDEAISVARATADLQLAFFEEPSPAADRLGRRRLNNEIAVPICGDESCITVADVSREISDGIAQMVSIKTARTGFSESRKILDFCEAMNVPIVIGNQGDTMVGTLASLHFGAAFKQSAKQPAELTNFLEITDDLLAEPLSIKNGEMILPHKSGLGIGIDEDKLNHYRIDK